MSQRRQRKHRSQPLGAGLQQAPQTPQFVVGAPHSSQTALKPLSGHLGSLAAHSLINIPVILHSSGSSKYSVRPPEKRDFTQDSRLLVQVPLASALQVTEFRIQLIRPLIRSLSGFPDHRLCELGDLSDQISCLVTQAGRFQQDTLCFTAIAYQYTTYCPAQCLFPGADIR